MKDEGKATELLFQIQEEIEDMEYELKDKIETSGGVEKQVLKRERNAVKDAKNVVVDKLAKLSEGIWKTECCDAEVRTLPTHSFGEGFESQCKECGEKNPETYNVEKSIEDLIEKPDEDQ